MQKNFMKKNNDDKIKCLIIGSSGQLGSELKVTNPFDNIELLTPTSSELNITSKLFTRQYLLAHRPNIIINCAAYNKVDEAETPQGFQAAYALNVDGVNNIIAACQEYGPMVFSVSTNYVFDGRKPPHRGYFEYDIDNPINSYGASKMMGECIIRTYTPNGIVIRTSSLYGKNDGHQKTNFVNKIVDKLKKGEEIKVIGHIMSPTYAKYLAIRIWNLIDKIYFKHWTTESWIYHITDIGCCSWYTFANTIAEMMGISANIKLTELKYPSALIPNTSDLDTSYNRFYLDDETNMQLANTNAYNKPWEEALKDYLTEIGV